MVGFGRLAGKLGRVALCAWVALALAACNGDGTDTANSLAPPTQQPVQDNPPPPPPAANHAPVLDGSPALTATAGTAYSFAPAASDADNDALSFSITGKPSWATFNVANGTLTGTPGDADVGETGDIEITVTDTKATDSIGPFRINVAAKNAAPTPSNTPPTISGTPAPIVAAGGTYIFVPTASDANGDKLSFSITNRPQWATFSTSNGQLSGTPTVAQVGTTSNIRITVSDGKATASLAAFSIQVQGPPNSAPTISGTPITSVQAGTAYSFQPTAADVDNNSLTWSIQNKPTWASFSTTTGKLSGTPATANVGAFTNIRISVSDGKLTTALAAFSINVTSAPNSAPTIAGTPATAVSAGSAYTFTPTGADADGDTLSYSVANKPVWANFSIATGQLSGTPTSGQTGTYANVTISVSDGKATAALKAFSIVVSATPNKAPTISGSPATTVKAGSAYSFTPSASDGDGDALTFSIANKPSWASFNTSNGALTGTPSAAGTTSNVTISVSDGKSTVALTAFSITVTAVAPTLSSVTLNWAASTQNTDGSQLQNLAGYRIYYGNSAGAMTQSVQVANPSINSYTIDNLASGSWYFSVRAYSSTGVESDPTNPVSVNLP
jgi:hypothetical protein